MHPYIFFSLKILAMEMSLTVKVRTKIIDQILGYNREMTVVALLKVEKSAFSNKTLKDTFELTNLN